MVQVCRRCGQVHDAYTGCTVSVRVTNRATVVGEDEALVGNVVAERYQVGDVLGKGTTGTVFAVEHLAFARAAAMKILRPHHAAADLVSRVFHGEARAAWSVCHPGLCEVFDIGALPDGTPFFVMERLEGETLATRIARERLSLASAVDVAMQLLAAIAAIHGRDLLLRDLRPQNIYLAHRRGCRPLMKILDFGLARLSPLDRIRAEWDQLRATVGASDAIGSTAIPFYLSPERTRGEHDIEPASDLFIAGVILYEALAGERPFSAPSFDGVLHQIALGQHIPLIEKRPDISPDLSVFLSRALSPNPRNRPATAKEMQDELRAVVEGAKRAHRESVAVPASPPLPRPEVAAASHDEPATFGSLVAPSTSMPGRPAPKADRLENAAFEALYTDETETKREPVAIAASNALPRLHGEEEQELSTASRRIDPQVLDEASADNTDRTVPPPPPDGIDVTFDDPAERTAERRGIPPGPGRDPTAEEEETETMELTPELKARVDQLMANRPAPLPAKLLPQPVPPPPRNAKPRR